METCPHERVCRFSTKTDFLILVLRIMPKWIALLLFSILSLYMMICSETSFVLLTGYFKVMLRLSLCVNNQGGGHKLYLNLPDCLSNN